jgi:hypothetical protein
VISTSPSPERRAAGRLAALLRGLDHRVDRVAHEVQDHLLELDRVGVDGRQIVLGLDAQAHAVQPRVRLGERAQVLEHAAAVHGLALDLAVLDEVPQAADHLAGPQRLGVDLVERRHDFVDLRLRQPQEPLAGLRIGRDGGQRLVDLVGEAGGHLAHRREPREMRQPVLQLARLVLGMPAIGDVVDRADVFQQSAVRIMDGLCDVVQVFQRPVGEHDAVLDVERREPLVHAFECGGDASRSAGAPSG